MYATNSTSTRGHSTHGRPHRSYKAQFQLEQSKTEHKVATAASENGEWVVKGKRHNRCVAPEPTQEQIEAQRQAATARDLAAIQHTVAKSMSVINQKKRQRNGNHRQGPASKKPRIQLPSAVSTNGQPTKVKNLENAFAALAVESSDDEMTAIDEFPTLGSGSTHKSSGLNYSAAVAQDNSAIPTDFDTLFPEPPTTFTTLKTGDSWADCV